MRLNVQTDIFCSVDLYDGVTRLRVEGCERWGRKRPDSFISNCSALSIPAPDRSVIAHGYQNAAVAAEAGLPDGRRAFGEGQCGAPEEQRGESTCWLQLITHRRKV